MRWDQRIGRRLKLRDLHTLLAVAERKSMAKAAADLALTQPAVTKAVAEMEHTLGVRLLDRTSRGVEPTLYGRALLKWCGVVFDDLHQAVKELDFLADPTAGELRIGAIAPMLQGLLPTILDDLLRRHPRIAFHVMPGNSAAEQYRELRERNIDLIIGRLVKAATDEDLETETLFDEPMHVVAGTRSRWGRRRSIRLAELVNEPWVLPRADTGPDSVAWPWIAETFRAEGLDVPQTCVASNSVPLQVALLSSGRCLAMLPRSLVWFSGKKLGIAILPVKLAVRPPPVGIVTLKNRTVSPVTRLFIQCAREIVRPLRDPAPAELQARRRARSR
jgi:DNA-binding transcriptional LysR family regulator